MNEKEKAKELINKFYDEIDYEIDGYKDDIPRVSKNCALMVVDEILDNNEECKSRYRTDYDRVCIRQYWLTVKQEINKL